MFYFVPAELYVYVNFHVENTGSGSNEEYSLRRSFSILSLVVKTSKTRGQEWFLIFLNFVLETKQTGRVRQTSVKKKKTMQSGTNKSHN